MRQFESMLAAHRPKLLRIAAGWVGDADAEDVVQIAAEKAWKWVETEGFEQVVDNFAAWMDTVLRNAARDVVRARNRRREIHLIDLVAGSSPIGIEGEVTEERGLTAALRHVDELWEFPAYGVFYRQQNLTAAGQALSLLNANRFAAVSARAAGFSYLEIAEEAQISEDAARDRVRCGWRQLRACVVRPDVDPFSLKTGLKRAYPPVDGWGNRAFHG